MQIDHFERGRTKAGLRRQAKSRKTNSKMKLKGRS